MQCRGEQVRHFADKVKIIEFTSISHLCTMVADSQLHNKKKTKRELLERIQVGNRKCFTCTGRSTGTSKRSGT